MKQETMDALWNQIRSMHSATRVVRKDLAKKAKEIAEGMDSLCNRLNANENYQPDAWGELRGHGTTLDRHCGEYYNMNRMVSDAMSYTVNIIVDEWPAPEMFRAWADEKMEQLKKRSEWADVKGDIWLLDVLRTCVERDYKDRDKRFEEERAKEEAERIANKKASEAGLRKKEALKEDADGRYTIPLIYYREDGTTTSFDVSVGVRETEKTYKGKPNSCMRGCSGTYYEDNKGRRRIIRMIVRDCAEADEPTRVYIFKKDESYELCIERVVGKTQYNIYTKPGLVALRKQ